MFNSRIPYTSSPIKKNPSVVNPVNTSYSRSPINYSRTPETSKKNGPNYEGGLNQSTAYKNNIIGNGEEIDLWKSRCNELESSLCQANTDLELAHFRAKKALELEHKCEELVRMNGNLSQENEGLQKQTNQRKAESDIWRQKYETQMNNIISLKSNYEMELKRLSTENARLRDELKQGEIDKVKENEDVRFKLTTDSHDKIENLKKAHLANIELYEEQLRKLRNIVEDREKEIAKLNSQISQARYDGSSEAYRLNEDREKLKMKISELEVESRQELENLRSKLDQQASEQLDSLKKLHDNELEVMNGEIHKLRNLLDVKTKEIEALIDQNRGLKRNYEEETHNLRHDLQAMKDRITDNNEFANSEISALHDQLHNQHTSDIQGLKFHHENQVQALNAEKEELQNIIDAKEAEIQNQIREKQLVRDSLNDEIDRLLADVDNWKLKYTVLDNQRAQENQEAAIKYDTLNNQQNEFAAAQHNQIKYLEEEIENLKQLLLAKNQEIDANRAQHAEIRDGLEQDISNAFAEIEEWKKKYAHLQHERDITVEDLKLKLSVLEAKANEQKKKLESTINYLKEDIQRLKDTIEIKEKEVQNHLKHRELQDREIKKLKQDNDSQNDHLRRLEKLKASELEDQRKKLETSNNNVIESIKVSHQNQVNIMNTEINDLKHLVNLKDQEVHDMINKYEKLESAIGEFKYNAEKLKEHQSQIQALGNEIINNKSIYDSYSKARHTRYPSSASKIQQ
ncbi:hypothetical protein ABPG72_004465 [Tetrahymena utriculariae]